MAGQPVVRVADEIVVDLMKAAGGIDYAGAAADVVDARAGTRGCQETAYFQYPMM